MAAKKGGFGIADGALLLGAGALAWFILKRKAPAASVSVGPLRPDPQTPGQVAASVIRGTYDPWYGAVSPTGTYQWGGGATSAGMDEWR